MATALDTAARCWPEDRDRRSRLLLKLIREGHSALLRADGEALEDRKAAIAATSGAMTGVYGADYLSALRRDWPE